MNPHNPFNGDRFVGLELAELIARFGVLNVIETGMWSAHTTRELRKLVSGRVITLDPDPSNLLAEFGAEAKVDLAKQRIEYLEVDSATHLTPAIALCHERDIRFAGTFTPILFYLDAHGGGINGTSTNPLREELDQISKCTNCHNNCVLFIHDFLNPKYPDPVTGYGYTWGDWGDGRGAEPLSYAVLEYFGVLPKIFPNGWKYHHNTEAVGTQRGVIYIYPKEAK